MFHISILGGLELCLGGLSPPKPPRGDETGRQYSLILSTVSLKTCATLLYLQCRHKVKFQQSKNDIMSLKKIFQRERDVMQPGDGTTQLYGEINCWTRLRVILFVLEVTWIVNPLMFCGVNTPTVMLPWKNDFLFSTNIQKTSKITETGTKTHSPVVLKREPLGSLREKF